MIRKKRNTEKTDINCTFAHKATAAASLCTIFLAVCTIFCSVFFQSAVQTPRAKNVIAETTAEANAETPPETEGLYLPGSYEEYMDLQFPTSIAVSEHYTAIADGKTIYVYIRAKNKYEKYEHGVPGDTEITQVQFDESEKLYFSAQGTTHLYTAQPETIEETLVDTTISCSSFDIYKDRIYYATISGSYANISVRPINALNAQVETLKEKVTGKPAIAYNGDALYYTVGEFLTKLGGTAPQTLESTPQSIAFFGEYCYFTDAEKKLYSCRYTSGSTPTELKQYNVTAISVSTSLHDKKIYVVGDKKIKQIDPDTREFTSFEISASSDSDGRLYRAVDACLAGNTLVTLDAGAPAQGVSARVLITPTTDSASPKITFPITETDGKFIAGDQKTVAVATAPNASVFPVQSGKLSIYDTIGNRIAEFHSENNEAFTGVTNVYGTYYAVSQSYIYEIARASAPTEGDNLPIEGGENAAISYTIRSQKTARSNQLLSSDVYGVVYLAQAGNVYAYTENELSAAFSSSETLSKPVEKSVVQLPETFGSLTPSEKIIIDFHRNVYALHGGTLTKCAKNEADEIHYDMTGKTYTYSQTAATPLISAAFGVESGATYLLYNGNFIIKTFDLPLPTVNTIATNAASESLFAESTAEFNVVECTEKTLLIQFDLTKLKGAAYFPYLSYARTTKKTPAISMGETNEYYILAVYNQTGNAYYTALAEKDSCEKISQNEFLSDPPIEYTEGKSGYVTNALPLYKYPYLSDLLAVCQLERGATVRVLKTVERLDWKYYQVEYTANNGETKTGFLPAAYVTNTNGSVPAEEKTTLGEENNNRDLVWRLAYILLGTLAICILADYLILHRSDKS